MTDKAISPLRRRLIEDMTIRRLSPKTHYQYIRHVKKFADFLGRSADKATAEDVHRYQLWLALIGTSVGTANVSATALRFFFKITLKRHDLAEKLISTREPRRLPVVLSPEEVGRLLAAATNIKHRAILSLAYATGLRASEVGSLKLTDIDRDRMLIRVEQGKGKKDRYVILSPILLEILHEWWRVARKKDWMSPGQPWLFPGYRGQHTSARQLHRIVRLAAGRAGITKRVGVHTLRHCFATHLLEQKTDIRIIQVLLGHKKLDTTALYTRVAIHTIGQVTSPLDFCGRCPTDARPLSRPTVEVADIFRRRGPAWRASHAGHVSLGQLKVMSAIERCRTAALGGHVERCEDCAHRRISYNSCGNRHCPKCQAAAAKEWLADRQAELLPVPYFHVVFTLPGPIGDIAYHNQAVVYDLLLKTAAETLITIAADPKHLGARIGLTAVLHTWGSAMTHHPHAHVIVPGGGVSPDGQHWITCRPRFFLSVGVLSRLFRRLFLERLTAAYQVGRLEFFANQAALAQASTLQSLRC